jgi:hypothetical protein
VLLLQEANMLEPDGPMPLKQVVLWLAAIALLVLVIYLLFKLGILRPDMFLPRNA